ncbi:MAG: hypothetical protein MJZ66_09790 [Bacteroidales bacterium]|nr:hypothetical protein [Bacteroidales bacterium]
MNKYVIISLIALLCGCGNGGHPSVSGSADPKSTEVLPQENPYDKPFPDTILPSAQYHLDWQVFNVDTSVSAYVNFETEQWWLNSEYTFRGGNKRDARFGGHLDSVPSDIEIEWQFTTDMDLKTTNLGTWGGGTGWTGQPICVEWPDEYVLHKDFCQLEIIFGSLCGKIYFLDYFDGYQTRKPIDAGNPIKGTIMVDPAVKGRIYAGHGVPHNQPFGLISIDLLNGGKVEHFPYDADAYRSWNAFDSSPVRVGDFVFCLGENGILYKFYSDYDKFKLHSKMRYRVQGASSTPGVESSMATYKNYGYFCDNNGNVICVNLNTLNPVWHYFNVDDSDASIVIEEVDGVPYIYAASEVDKQHGHGAARIVKLNGLNGKEIWNYEMMLNQVVSDGTHFDGGFYATPLLGRGNCSHLLFVNRVDNAAGTQSGHFIAINRNTGKLVYEKKLDCYSWSSPVSLMGPNETEYVFTADTHGYVYLFDGISGNLVCKKLIGTNFESSPLVSQNLVFIGSRGNQMYCLEIK